jgi:hypothetical protein
MKKIFARQKDGGKGSTKITPLTLDVNPNAQLQPHAKRSPDAPMQFARHSASDEPDPWVLVSGAKAKQKLDSAGHQGQTPQPHQHQHPRRRSSTGDDFTLLKPRPVLETRPPPHPVLPPGASPPVPGTVTGLPTSPPLDHSLSTPTPTNRDKDIRAMLKKKNGHTHGPSSLLRSLDPRANDSQPSPPLSAAQTQEEPARLDRDAERPERPERKKPVPHPEKKERPRDREKDRTNDEYAGVSIRTMIGKLICSKAFRAHIY